MMEIIQKAVEYGQPIAELLGWIAVLATFVIRMPFLKADPTKVDGFVATIQKAIAWLPTIGLNPRTDHMEAAIKEMKES